MKNLSSPFRLDNVVVLVTGGAGFLGEYFIRALSEAGASTVIADVNIAHAQTLAKNIEIEYSTPALALEMDVTNKESIETAFLQIVDAYKTVDVVVNNAAIDPKFDKTAEKNTIRFENYPLQNLEESIKVNLLGYTLVAQAAVAQMIKQGHGNIVNVSSIYGMVGPDQDIYPDGSQKPVDYAITKGGVTMLTKWIATSYGDQGIRANTLTLGGVEKGHGDEFKENYGARTPLGRMALPQEVGSPLVYLASDASSYMTGANLVVDGGWTAW